MAANLMSRIEKLEASSRAEERTYPRVVRLVVNEGEEAEAYRMAEEMGLHVGPDSRDIVVIRLVAGRRVTP